MDKIYFTCCIRVLFRFWTHDLKLTKRDIFVSRNLFLTRMNHKQVWYLQTFFILAQCLTLCNSEHKFKNNKENCHAR